jgi:hypothetical protein
MTSLICQWHQHGEIREPVPRVTRHGLPRTHGAVRDEGVGADGDGAGDMVLAYGNLTLTRSQH